MNHYDKTANTWNKLASLYEEKFMALTLYDETYDFLCDSLNENQTHILELGCGPGMIARYFLNKRPNFHFLGTDVSPYMVELAQKNNPSGQFHQLDCREIKSLDKKFDALVIGFCIPYINPEDVAKLISDSSEILNQNGLIYLSFVNGEDALSGFKTGSSGDKMYFYYHQTERIRQLLMDSGFQITRIFEVPYPISNNESEIHTVICAAKTSSFEI